jgi:hypothetical protein
MTIDYSYFNPTQIVKSRLTQEEKQIMFSKIQINTDKTYEWFVTVPFKEIDESTGEQYETTRLVAECEFYKDSDNSIWINKIISYGVYQGIGVGTEIIKKAIEKFGVIYISNALRSEMIKFSKHKANDFRYFSDAEKFEDSFIGIFANKLIQKGILSIENIKNPYKV